MTSFAEKNKFLQILKQFLQILKQFLQILKV